MTFYQSRQWQELRNNIILERVSPTGDIICGYCHKPILNKYDLIAHHIVPVEKDKSLVLSEDNIMLVHHKCHNLIHKRFGSYDRHIYIVYGPPKAGKREFVEKNALPEDLIIDIDSIYKAINTSRSNRLLDNVMSVYRHLIDMVRTNNGKWINAWIISLFPYRAERERLADLLGGELIHIDTDKETCLSRCCDEAEKKLVEDFFQRFQP